MCWVTEFWVWGALKMTLAIFYFLCTFLLFRRGGQVWGRVSVGDSGLVGLIQAEPVDHFKFKLKTLLFIERYGQKWCLCSNADFNYLHKKTMPWWDSNPYLWDQKPIILPIRRHGIPSKIIRNNSWWRWDSNHEWINTPHLQVRLLNHLDTPFRVLRRGRIELTFLDFQSNALPLSYPTDKFDWDGIWTAL